MAKGKVKFFDAYEGYGYIESEDADESVVYVESASVKDRQPLAEGQEVEYEVSDSDEGPVATEVMPA